MQEICIALDVMSGDRGIDIVIPAAHSSLKKHSNLRLILVGDQFEINSRLNKWSEDEKARITIQHASEVVDMTELPSQALRYKKDSSMRVAINLVKEGKAKACVSAGNTGALMATARFVLKTLSGINRPAIIKLIPAKNELKRVRVLDLGANIDSSAEMLVQFAVMGSVLTSAVDGIERPTVALLNIGAEEIKGNEAVKRAAQMLLANKDINYIGFAEGNDIFKGDADVIVCDGFVGNVALKAMEGLSGFIGHLIKQAVHRNIFTKLAAIFAIFVLKPVVKFLNPERYNGASFVGLRGIVIKSHGNVSSFGFEQAIERAIGEVDHNVPELISAKVAKLLG